MKLVSLAIHAYLKFPHTARELFAFGLRIKHSLGIVRGTGTPAPLNLLPIALIVIHRCQDRSMHGMAQAVVSFRTGSRLAFEGAFRSCHNPQGLRTAEREVQIDSLISSKNQHAFPRLILI